MENRDKLTELDYRRALDTQGACNLSGLVFSFAEVMQRICNEAHQRGEGTDWRNTHPIARLYAEQIAHLTAAQPYHGAHAICERYAREIPKPAPTDQYGATAHDRQALARQGIAWMD